MPKRSALHLESCIGEHPDTLLRKLGILRQRAVHGRFKKKQLEYNSEIGEWCREGTCPPEIVPGFVPSESDARYDEAPKGVILVLGSLELEPLAQELIPGTPVTSGESVNTVAMEKKIKNQVDDFKRFLEYQAEKLNDRAAGVLLASLDNNASTKNVIANMGDAEADGAFLTEDELTHCRAQYLFRSIPQAALKEKALILTSCDRSVEQLISKGLASVNEDGDVNALLVSDDLTRVNATNFTHVLSVSKEDQSHVTSRELNQCVHNIALELNSGSAEFTDLLSSEGKWKAASQVPTRNICPVVTVVFGGDATTTKLDLLTSVGNGWPIFLVEGSGGYTDKLISMIGSLQDLENELEKRVMVSRMDAETAEIVSSGRCHIVTKGQVADTFTHSLKHSITGDNTLKLAWQKYTSWKSRSRDYDTFFTGFLLAILLVGIVSIGLSIFQTFMQVQWPEETIGLSGTTGEETNITDLYNSLNLVVIFLPILMHLCQQVSNKVNAGSKWAGLRWAAESVFREIYMLRLQVGDYSRESVHRAAKKAAQKKMSQHNRYKKETEGGEMDDEEEEVSYSSRQELLHQRVEAYTNEVGIAMENAVIGQFEGPVPPREIAINDDGFSDMTADEYVSLRLLPAITEYQKVSTRVTSQRRFIEAWTHFFNTAGTILGALATYETVREHNLQSWVAFTTALVSAASRFEHWMMYEWQQHKFSETSLKLQAAHSWWTSRGGESGMSSVKNELASKVESSITAEVDEFRQQLRTTLESTKKAADEMLEIKDQAVHAAGGQTAEESKKKRDAQMKTKELQVVFMTTENIASAIENPKGMESKLMKRILNDLNSEFGGVLEDGVARSVEFAVTLADAGTLVQDFKEIASEVVDVNACLQLTEGMSLSETKKLLPQAVGDLVREPHRRVQFMRGIQKLKKDVGNIQMGDFLQCSSLVDAKLKKQMEALPVRLLLESVQSVIQEETIMQFSTLLQSAHIAPHEIVPRQGNLKSTINCLLPVVATPWRSLSHQQILDLVEEPRVRHVLSKLSEPKMRSLMKRVESFYQEPSTALAMENNLADQQSELDFYNSLAVDDVTRIKLCEARDNLTSLNFSFNLMNTSQIKAFFPPDYRSLVDGCDHASLVALARRVSEGLPLTRSIRATVTAWRADKTKANSPMLLAIRNPACEEQIALLCQQLTPREVVSLNKETILRRLRGLQVAETSFEEDLRKVPSDVLRTFLNTALSHCGRSMVGRVFDQLSIDATSFDVKATLGYEDCVVLFSRLKEFRGKDLLHLEMADMLKMIGVRSVCQKLGNMFPDQLREMLRRLMLLARPVFVLFGVAHMLLRANLERHANAFSKLSYFETKKLIATLALCDHPGAKEKSYKVMQDPAIMTDAEVSCMLKSLDLDNSQLFSFALAAKQEFSDEGSRMLLSEISLSEEHEGILSAVARILADASARSDFLHSLGILIEKTSDVWKLMTDLSQESAKRALEVVVKLLGNPDDKTSLNYPLVKLHRAIQATLGEFYVTYLVATLGNALVRVPVFLFHDCATDIKEFDVRATLTTLDARLDLAHVFLAAHESGITPNSSHVEMSKKLLKYIDRHFPSCHALVTDLRALPSEFVATLYNEMSQHLHGKSKLGYIFRQVCKKDTTVRRRALIMRVDHICVVLQAAIDLEPETVRRSLENFDVTAFKRRESKARVDIFAKYLGSDYLARQTERWETAELSSFMTILRSRAVYNMRRAQAAPDESLTFAEVVSSVKKSLRVKAKLLSLARVPSSVGAGDAMPGAVETDEAAKRE